MRLVLIGLALLGLVGIWAYHASLVPGLPEQIPVHFNAAGSPDRMAPKSELVILPWVDSLMTLVFVGLGFLSSWLARVAPGMVNVPQKDKFVTLSPEGRARALEPVGACFAWIAFANHGLFAYLLWVTSEVALGHRDRMSPTPIAGSVAVMVVSAIVMTAATRSAVQREVEAARTASPGSRAAGG